MDPFYIDTLKETLKKDKQRLAFYETSLVNLKKRIDYLQDEFETTQVKILETEENIKKIEEQLSIDK